MVLLDREASQTRGSPRFPTKSHLINSPEPQVEAPQWLKATSICTLYAALKRRSFTVVRADSTTEGRALPEPTYAMASKQRTLVRNDNHSDARIDMLREYPTG